MTFSFTWPPARQDNILPATWKVIEDQFETCKQRWWKQLNVYFVHLSHWKAQHSRLVNMNFKITSYMTKLVKLIKRHAGVEKPRILEDNTLPKGCTSCLGMEATGIRQNHIISNKYIRNCVISSWLIILQLKQRLQKSWLPN